jgi:hypothetical protein
LTEQKSAELASGNHDVILSEITGSGEQILEFANVSVEGERQTMAYILVCYVSVRAVVLKKFVTT